MRVKPTTTVTSTTVSTIPPSFELSAKVKRLIDTLRPTFTSFVSDFHTVTLSRAELAPSFMKACTAFQSETSQTFVAFVRLLDPSVGSTRDEYRSHKAYQAADYLRRLISQQSRPKVSSIADTRATPLDGMARLLASMLPLISADQTDQLWKTVGAELHWTDRQIVRLKHMTDTAVSLVSVRPPKGTVAPQLRLAPIRSHASSAHSHAAVA